jgi:hypothetical protein
MNPDYVGNLYPTPAELLKKMDAACLRYAIQAVTTPDVAILQTATLAMHVTLGIPVSN